MKVLIPRRNWTIVKSARPPEAAEAADVRFLEFRNSLPEIHLGTSRRRSWLCLVFDQCDKKSAFAVADNLIFEITPEMTLAAIWITAIDNDRGARGMAAWRKKLKEDDSQSDGGSPYVRIEVKRSPK